VRDRAKQAMKEKCAAKKGENKEKQNGFVKSIPPVHVMIINNKC
jgi:hypothetical protein